VKWYTQDIQTHGGKRLSDEQIETIRKEVMQGKSKYQAALDLNISYMAVLKYTRNLPGKRGSNETTGRIEITEKNFNILRTIVRDGYYFCSHGDSKSYFFLKKHFPTIRKVRLRRKTILFLEDKSDVAVKAFLGSFDKRISNYHELKDIINMFKPKKGWRRKIEIFV
jgi:hypothetical protein